jgi:hypothetical protein
MIFKSILFLIDELFAMDIHLNLKCVHQHLDQLKLQLDNTCRDYSVKNDIIQFKF